MYNNAHQTKQFEGKMLDHAPFDPEVQILDESWAMPPDTMLLDDALIETGFEHGWKSAPGVTLPYSGTMQ